MSTSPEEKERIENFHQEMLSLGRYAAMEATALQLHLAPNTMYNYLKMNYLLEHGFSKGNSYPVVDNSTVFNDGRALDSEIK